MRQNNTNDNSKIYMGKYTRLSFSPLYFKIIYIGWLKTEKNIALSSEVLNDYKENI